MSNMLWPGDHRAGEHMTDEALLGSMIAVECAWLDALAAAGLAPADCAEAELWNLVTHNDCESIAVAAEGGGNPVIPLVQLLRQRAESRIAPWIHRGLTSQDVLDTGLMLALRRVADDLTTELRQQISTLSALATDHRDTPMVARTLTQHAAPTTFGVKAAGWLNGIVDAFEGVAALTMPIQIGGAAGTLAGATELAALLTDATDAARVALRLVQNAATTLGLRDRPAWHTARAPVTAAADAFVGCTDAWGRIASDIVTLARPEIAELDEPAAAGRGGSSSMPRKRNPVLSILIRRAAIVAPQLAATLHTAAALANDERPDGAWHAEWDTLRTLARRTVVAGSESGELLGGLTVHAQRMAENLAAAEVLGERRAIAELVGKEPSSAYIGAAQKLIDASLGRAARALAQR
ncbi:lyase family protein [Mycobacterium sp. 1165178.9]|uniref:lyase family protein n=1 Tax=Mycobacterium sp. 1165178.9 TaxID=1834070 RepID=UPI0007FBA149|nr:lyase family protein [Mycobacterium sp. 1165178.9]OBK95460.1 3-carboxy-cis,cis-muconate cycloisomerase [Mycobacterium sp. 1165178.9]